MSTRFEFMKKKENIKSEIKILSVNGMLGYGYQISSFNNGIKQKPDLIGCDAGSTDPGPYYLGSGKSLVKSDQIYRDLKPALVKAVQKKIPFAIGSAGFAGAKPNLEFMLQIVHKYPLDIRIYLYDPANILDTHYQNLLYLIL